MTVCSHPVKCSMATVRAGILAVSQITKSSLLLHWPESPGSLYRKNWCTKALPHSGAFSKFTMTLEKNSYSSAKSKDFDMKLSGQVVVVLSHTFVLLLVTDNFLLINSNIWFGRSLGHKQIQSLLSNMPHGNGCGSLNIHSTDLVHTSKDGHCH